MDQSPGIAWLYADQAKNKTDLSVPLSSMTIAVIGRRLGSHDTHAFNYRGNPLRNINADAWQRTYDMTGSAISAGTTSGIFEPHGTRRMAQA